MLFVHEIEKNIFRKPDIIQIVPKGPKYVYQIDLTEIPIKLQTDENAKYIISIIDTFSKFGYCYILNNKRADSVLGKIKDFINKFGKPNSIQTDKGKEFTNALLNKYCDELEIKLFLGRPYLPQSQGAVQSFNKEIKRLLEVKYLESKKDFSIYTILPDIIEIYNFCD